MLKSAILSLVAFCLSTGAFLLYVNHTRPAEERLTLNDMARLMRGERIGPADDLSLREYVALSVQTKPGDPIGYYCDGPFCVPLSKNITLGQFLSSTWLLTANQIEQGMGRDLPGKAAGLKMSSDKAGSEKSRMIDLFSDGPSLQTVEQKRGAGWFTLN